MNPDLCQNCTDAVNKIKGQCTLHKGLSFYGMIYDNFAKSSEESWTEPDGTVWTKDNWQGHPVVKKLKVPQGVQIGDTVKIINPGKMYFSFTAWAQRHNLNNLEDTDLYYKPREGRTYKVVALGQHSPNSNPRSNNLLAGIRAEDKREFIIEVKGLEVISPAAGENPVPTQLLWNCKCAICGSDAYTGLLKVECSNENCGEEMVDGDMEAGSGSKGSVRIVFPPIAVPLKNIP